MIVSGGVPVDIESRSYGAVHSDYTYKDQPTYSIISLQGDLIECADGKLGQSLRLTPPGDDPVLLMLQPGNNYALPTPASGTHWYVATPDAPLNTVRGFDALYAWVPPGMGAGTVFCHAFSPKEAGWLIVSDADGNELASLESDFNEPEALMFRLRTTAPEGSLIKISLLKPQNPDWTIDDAKVWLGPELPGLVAPSLKAADGIAAIARRVGIETDWTPLCDFETENPFTTIQWSKPVPEHAELPAYDVGLSGEQSFGGGNSLRVQMRFPENDEERSQELKLFTKPLPMEGVRQVRFFLYGDGSGRKIIVRVRDESQEHHYCSVGVIDWTGWKAVVADFQNATTSIAGGDENKRIDGPTGNVVIQLQHTTGNALESVLYIDDLSVRMGGAQ
ncbi:MAG TPA: hypothetical protein DGT21_03295 [Armatimonadetes bacterium]|nr:hypothetical protein [Armatimonadota bacterium]